VLPNNHASCPEFFLLQNSYNSKQDIFLKTDKKSSEMLVWDKNGGVAGYGLSPLLAG